MKVQTAKWGKIGAIVCIVLCVVLCIFVPRYVLTILFEREPHTLRDDSGSKSIKIFPDYLLIVGRREERSSESDNIPHRNSRIGLYKFRGGKWVKEAAELPIRSRATLRDFSQADCDASTDELFDVGYESVPVGLYNLSETKWRDTERPAYLISDWGRVDGDITLKKPQVIRRIRFSSSSTAFSTEVIRSSVSKKNTFIHSTHTKSWSRRDSDGCMNLYAPKEGNLDGTEYGDFVEWIRKCRSDNTRGVLPALIVVPWSLVAETKTDGLREILGQEVIEFAINHQGFQIEDLGGD